MHIADITSASLDGLIEPVDLGQTPADIAVLSFSDSDLSAIAQAHDHSASKLPDMRLASLRDLRHPMSVDLWAEKVAAHATTILVRVLGGYDWWPYGCDTLSALARAKGLKLALLPGECSERDDRLAALSTVEAGEIEALLACFREGGPDNMARLLARLARLSGGDGEIGAAEPVPQMGFYRPGEGAVDIAAFTTSKAGKTARPGPAIPLLFYRSMLLANDIAPIDALAEALAARGLTPVPIFLPTLKSDAVAGFLRQTAAALAPAAMVTTTAFAASLEGAGRTVFDEIGVPVFQAIIATTRHGAWAEGDRGLGVSDLAMHVVLPELDGRVLAGALSFKDLDAQPGALEYRAQRNCPEPALIAMAADRIAALATLKATAVAERRLLIVMPDYPGAGGRTGYAVGLDVPQSVLAILADLRAAGYTVENIPKRPRDLLALMRTAQPAFSAGRWRDAFKALPGDARAGVEAAWGPPPEEDFSFAHAQFGHVTVALAPDRGRAADRRVDYHDLSLPPDHALLAFGAWARHGLGCHALIHCGAHGTLEWLPGKAVALSRSCFPEIVAGALPVVYPFIVNNPGEAAQAKRRIAAVTLGHMPAAMVGAGLTADEGELERLVDEYVQADGMDFPRRDRLHRLILEKAAQTGLDRIAGVGSDADDGAALKKIDAWLCDLKDFAVKDGQHVYGRAEAGCADPLRLESAASEKAALIAALDGKYIAPGPAGSPLRGRIDVFPTGRNLFTVDPRTMPTPTAFEMGRDAADELIRFYRQEHGRHPRALVIDLWASASLRTAGEEIAQGLALMGCRPQWDGGTGRVTGIEVLPPAAIGRPRVDVTWRISGLFRDMFPAQIALLAAAADAVARRPEEASENPLAAEFRKTGVHAARVFGSAPGTYGSGAEALLESGDWHERDDIGEAYLKASAFAFSGAEGTGESLPGAFAERIKGSDLLVHPGDEPGRDLLEGSADAAFIGGFAAAAAAIGANADLVTLDTTDPRKPRARSLVDALTRVVRARAVNPRYIAGQMRHGPRGASDFAETVDRLVAFAETTNAVPDALIGAVHDAYVADEAVRDFMLRENPQAARAIASRLKDARRRGLWHPLRNSVDGELDSLAAAAQAPERVS